MADFTTTKTTGSQLTASEWNQLADVDNFTLSSDQVPGTGDLNQIGKGVAAYTGQAGIYTTDSGSADAYVVTQVSPFKAPHKLFNGLTIRFRTSNTNTGACTVNAFTLGVKNIKLDDGSTDPAAGDISTTKENVVVYDGTVFRLKKEEINPPNDNLIINGDFRIWQRSGFATLSHTAPAAFQYGPDRWGFEAAGSGYAIDTIASTNLPTGSFVGRSYRIETTTAKGSLASSDFLNVRYRVEGYDYAKLHDGNFTVSFFARTNKAGKYGVSFFNSAHNRIYTTEIDVTSGDASSENWVKYTITITADSSGTWLFDNGIGLQMTITYASGSGAQTSTLDQWQNDTGVILTSNNQTNLLDAVSNYFEVYKVKLEEGSVATDFISRPIQQEVALCQRYYEKSYNLNEAPGTITNNGMAIERSDDSTYFLNIDFKCNKRSTPTVISYNPNTGASGSWRTGSGTNQSPTAIQDISDSSFIIFFSGGASATNIFGHWIAEAEL